MIWVLSSHRFGAASCSVKWFWFVLVAFFGALRQNFGLGFFILAARKIYDLMISVGHSILPSRLLLGKLQFKEMKWNDCKSKRWGRKFERVSPEWRWNLSFSRRTRPWPPVQTIEANALTIVITCSGCVFLSLQAVLKSECGLTALAVNSLLRHLRAQY